MKFVIYGTYIPADQLVEVARDAERLGFDGISIPDHVVFPHSYGSSYPYPAKSSGDRAPWDEGCEWPDPLIMATAMTAATERLRVITGIFVLPMRDPLLVAKAVSTLAITSNGRFILGVGVGWLEEEFKALGAQFRRRGKRSEEMIDVMRKAWSGERFSHSGEFFELGEMTMRPAPSRPVPLYLGGDSAPTIDRAARLADGMLPPLNSEKTTAKNIATITERRRELGIEAPFEYIAPATSAKEPGIEELAAAGVESVHIDPFAMYVQRYGGLTLEQRRESLERYAEEILRPVNGG